MTTNTHVDSDSQDPTSGQGTDLITSSTGGTMSLMMGTTFSAPPPYRSQDRLLKFNILLSNSLDVFTAEDGTNRPTLSSAIRPASLNSRSAQPSAGGAQWSAAKDAWKTQIQTLVWDDEVQNDISVVDSAIRVWTQAVGWSTTGSSQLKSTLGDGDDTYLWKQFDQLYMAAPMVAVA